MGKALAKTYNFVVYFDQTRIPFSKVSGIESRVNNNVQEEGGQNTTGYIMPSTEKTPKDLVLERAICINEADMVNITTDTVIENEITVYLCDDQSTIYKAYYLMGCTINAVSIDALDAKNSEVLNQKIEISYQTLEIENFERTTA